MATTVTPHVFPIAVQQLTQKAFDWQGGTVDTLRVLLANGTITWNATSEAYATVAAVLANSGGSALTEVSSSGTGYARATLAGVGVATSYAAGTAYTSLTATSPIQWSSATFSANLAIFYDAAVDTSDSTRIPLCYWDMESPIPSASNGTFTLNLGTLFSVANCLLQFAAS